MSKKRKKAGIQNAIFLLSCVIALIAGIIFVGWADKYSIVWRYSMFMNTPNTMLAVSTILTACTVAPIYKWLNKQIKPPRESNTNYGVYLFVFLIGFPILMCTTQLGIIINGVFDDSETQTFRTVIISKRETHAARGGKQYYIRVEDWHDPHHTVQVMASKSNYGIIEIGDTLDIRTKRGFLGYEWMVGPDFMKGKWPFDLPDY